MERNNHKLISDLSVKYADRMCGGDNDRKFGRGSIAAAYIIGAEDTLHRVHDAIGYSVTVGGLTPTQAGTLLRIIDDIEATSDTPE